MRNDLLGVADPLSPSRLMVGCDYILLSFPLSILPFVSFVQRLASPRLALPCSP